MHPSSLPLPSPGPLHSTGRESVLKFHCSTGLLKFPPALGEMSLAPRRPDQTQTPELSSFSSWQQAPPLARSLSPSGPQTHGADTTLTSDSGHRTLRLMEPHPSLPFLSGWARSSWAPGPAPKPAEDWSVYRASWRRWNTQL